MADGAFSFEEALSAVPEDVREAVRQRWEQDRVQVEPVGILSDSDDGRREWFEEWDPAQGYHWRRLRDFLIVEKGRSDATVESLDQSTDQILSMLEDPRPEGPGIFQIRGLVVGYVQSGKTANFSALIAKAVDAGYKIVIVLSGLHNSLRRQTQLRLEDELGLVEPAPGRPAVGSAAEGHRIHALTGADIWQDFHPGTAPATLLQGDVNLILVMKKNASILRRFVAWLQRQQPITPPVLVIDDEADQASINTGGNRVDHDITLGDLVDLSDSDVEGGIATPELSEADPSVINGLVRLMLDRMNRVSYVGYTATPFANVLIDKDAHDRDVGADLYPRDFIVSLPKPPGYVGTERLFGRSALAGEGEDVPPLDVIREVPQADADLLNPGRSGVVTGIPASLRTALLDFVLAMAARDVRTGKAPASAMLIHASPYTADQQRMTELVIEALASLRQSWRYGDGDDQRLFRDRWDAEFRPVSAAMDPSRALSFEKIESALNRNFRSEIPVLCLNNTTDDELDYERHPNIRAVVVGGNKLSRGLTLEGLLVSYYVRPANYFDTLLQMGRWFGYREDYVDLTRLYTTPELRGRFRDLATAEEALRREIRLYEALGKTPREFGPRIMAHHSMQITARNRMGSARPATTDYSGSLIQTIVFHLRRREWLEANLDAVRSFLSGLGSPNDVDRGRLPGWRDVDWRSIVALLNSYKTHPESVKFSSVALQEYIHEQASRHHELIRWRVAVRGRLDRDRELGGEDLHIAGWGPVNCINRSREPQSEISIGTLVNPVSRGARGGDEEVGLSETDIEAAQNWSREKDVSYALALRRRRDPAEGLLLVYPISRFSRQLRGEGQNLFVDVERDGVTVVGLAAVLPFSESAATTRYVVGSAGAYES